MTSGGARGGAVSSGTALQTSRSWVRFSMVSLELTQPLTEISTRNISWGGGGGKKGAGGRRENLIPLCWGFSFPETLRACPGTTLPYLICSSTQSHM